MAEIEIAGTKITVDDDGFMQDSTQWSEEIAKEIAKKEGISELTDKHWTVLKFMRQKQEENGTAPSIRLLGKQSGVSIKELYTLFPKGPAKLAAKIAGVPKPRGCI